MQNRQHTELTTDQSPSRARQAVAWITLIAYIGQPMAATAQVIAAQNAAAQNRPVIDNTANGIPLVQIVAPNAAGISHNQFTQYNVDPGGLILNNSNAAVQTQQAGYVSANPNMAGGTARIILNEVTSTSQSQLNGYTEVAGTRAEVIIANPNGINCNGCGFINTSRGVLTTGTPVFGGSGSLDSFRVTGGQITVGSGGLIDGSTDQLDLIARSVKVNDTLWANNNLNVITGTNQVNYANLGVQVITGDANKPTVGIDVAQLGGMYANKIKLIGTETGVGVNSQGTLAAQAGDFTLDNQGQITLAGATSASGNLTITGIVGTTNSGTLYSEQNVLITDHGAIANSGILSARGNLTLDGASISSSGTLGAGIAKDGTVALTDGTDTRQGVMKLIATNQIDATGQNIAGTGLSMAGNTINLANSQAMVGGGGAILTATAGDIINDGGTFQSLGSLTLNAAGGVVSNAGGTIASALDTTVTTNTVTGTGKIIAGRDATVSLKGDYTSALGNVIQANRDLTFTTTGAFTNLATLESFNKLTLNASNLDNRASAIINAGDTTLNIGTGSITNAGRIEGNTVIATSDSFANTGTVIGDNLTLNANSITNSGASAIIAGTQSVNLAVKNSLLNQGGATIYSYLGDINIGADLTQDANGFLIGNTGSVTNTSSTIEAGGNLRISANQLINERTVVGVEMGPITSQSVVTGTLGSPGAPGAPSYTANYANEQFTLGTTDAGQLLAGANMRLNAATVTNNYSDIIAGQTLQINGAVNNIGDPFKQRMTVTNGTQELWSYVATGWHWGVKCSWKGCWPTRVTDYGWTHYPISWTQAASVSTPATNPTQYTKAVDPTLVIGKRGDSQTPLNKAGVPNGSGATLTVPASGLYTIHNQPGQPYLVVTDPRFANYQNYVSSDYMLSRLALDPGMIEKRLGDGFYEQKLVTDQVTQLTGRRYLGQSASAEEQFKALMLSGVAVAKEFKLILGVGLTKEQMAALTTDIVWMVEQTVALPSGGTTKVLAPQVYLSQLHAGDLKPSGALLAAEAIDINTSGTLMNSGTIRSTSATNIAAQDIMNLGGTIGSSGTINLQAVNDIVNRSGKIAGNNVNLTAGRDVINERTAKETTTTVVATTSKKNGPFDTIQSTVAGNSSNTELGLETGITAADGLNITAGRDISIVAANLKAGGNASLNAAENITVGTIAAQQKNTGAYNAYINTVTNQTSQIDIGGNLDMKAGNNLQMTAAKVNAGKDLTLQAGGNIDLKAAKNTTAFGYDSGVAQESKYDETVLGTTLKAGGNVTLVATRMNGDAAPAGSVGNPAGRTDGKGNITLEAAQLQGQGATVLVADNNIDIKTADEAHSHELAIRTQSQGLTTTTTRTTRDETWSTDTIGSSLSGDSISITSGRDINFTGSSASAEHNIQVAAMGDVNIAASTDTYGSEHYSHEINEGWQAKNAFSITNHGPETTSKARTDGTNQSFNRSSLNSKEGNLSILSGGNLISSGADLVADKGDLALTAGGTVALLAGQDTLNQSSSTKTVTQDNIFTKQRHTITDTYASLDYQGSTLNGKSVKINSGADTILQATTVTAGEGGITIDAGGDLKLLAAANQRSHTHTETLATDGYTFRADGSLNDTDTRRMNNKHEEQSATNQVVSLFSKGDITTKSGGDTLIEASNLDAQGSIALSAIGYEAAYNEDGTLKYEGRKGTVTFAAIKDSNYINEVNSSNSMPWQSSSGHGEMVETIKLANIKAGKGMTVDAKGGIIVDIPEVPKEAPAPVEVVAIEEPIPTFGPDGQPFTEEQKAALVAERKAKAAEKAAQAAKYAAEKPLRDEKRFNDHIQALAGKPGQEWIGQLAKLAKEKPDQVKLQQVNAALEKWDYAHDGLTPEATAVIVIVVTYFTAGTGSGIASTGGASVATATGSAALGAAATAAISTLASQAVLAIINNKGNVGKALDDMGKSENVRALALAMVTAGVLQGLNSTLGIEKINAQSTFGQQLGKNLIDNAASTVINHAINGGDLRQMLEQSLKGAFIDTGAAQGANWIGDQKFNTFNNKLAHAIAGCAAGAARANDCSSGALGAVVGEITAELYTPADSRGLTPRQLQNMQSDMVGFSKMMSGVAAAITGQDVNLAAGAGANAAENNYLSHWQQAAYGKELDSCKGEMCRVGTHLRWMGTSVNQDAALVTGMALGATIEVKDAVAGLADLPQTIAMLGQHPELLKGLGDNYLQGLQSSYDKYQKALESAGVDGATAAGVEFTHLLSQIAMLPATVGTAGAAGGYAVEKMAGLLGKIGKAAETVQVVDAGVLWGKGIQGQGMPWEDYLASNLPEESRLPANFKTFDFFDKDTGVATSAKTLDTMTSAKLADPSQVYSSLKGNIDAAVNFETYSLGKNTLSASQITARELQIAVPAGTTPAQWQQISKAIEYGQSQGVKVIVTKVK